MDKMGKSIKGVKSLEIKRGKLSHESEVFLLKYYSLSWVNCHLVFFFDTQHYKVHLYIH